MRRTDLSAFSLLFLSAVAASPSFAALDKYKDWEKSPEYAYLATDDDKKEWKKIASDQDAEKFIAVFWARRDPLRVQNIWSKQRVGGCWWTADSSKARRNCRTATTSR